MVSLLELQLAHCGSSFILQLTHYGISCNCSSHIVLFLLEFQLIHCDISFGIAVYILWYLCWNCSSHMVSLGIVSHTLYHLLELQFTYCISCWNCGSNVVVSHLELQLTPCGISWNRSLHIMVSFLVLQLKHYGISF